MEHKNTIKIFIDGGARGNPGPGALGVVITDRKGKILKEYSQELGVVSNNQAEYKALIFALKKAKQLFGKKKIKEIKVKIFSDSKLLTEQLKGRYKILDPEIQKLFIESWNLKTEFPNLEIEYIPREKNKRADFLVNEVLDRKQEKLF
jgi:ribonuclease HI